MVSSETNPNFAIGVESKRPSIVRAARSLAEQTGAPLIHGKSNANVCVAFTDEFVELRQPNDRPGRGVSVDFAPLCRQVAAGKISRKQPLGKAIGPNNSTVVDATAGLGGDTGLLAAMGFEVVAIERSPILGALIQDGLRRARRDGGPTAEIAARINLHVGDAIEILPQLETKPDAVYIDPMFPPKRKTAALAKKDIRMVRAIVGNDADSEDLLDVARSVAQKRVTVKRPTHAPPLHDDIVHEHGGKLVRYDVYLPYATACGVNEQSQ